MATSALDLDRLLLDSLTVVRPQPRLIPTMDVRYSDLDTTTAAKRAYAIGSMLAALQGCRRTLEVVEKQALEIGAKNSVRAEIRRVDTLIAELVAGSES